MRQAKSLNELYEQVALRRLPFFIVFFGIVTVSYAALFTLDFIPEPVSEDVSEVNTPVIDSLRGRSVGPNGGLVPKKQDTEEEVQDDNFRVIIPDETSANNNAHDALPISIIFDSLDGHTVSVSNPTSREVSVLDQALLSGAVRYPDSADFSDKEGNMFILAHSSYLPNVFNKSFQAFNGIQELTWGDLVRVRSTDAEYVYRVDRVYKARASEVEVPLNTGEQRLTLATCNSFGTKDDRFIVEATLVETKNL